VEGAQADAGDEAHEADPAQPRRYDHGDHEGRQSDARQHEDAHDEVHDAEEQKPAGVQRLAAQGEARQEVVDSGQAEADPQVDRQGEQRLQGIEQAPDAEEAQEQAAREFIERFNASADKALDSVDANKVNHIMENAEHPWGHNWETIFGGQKPTWEQLKSVLKEVMRQEGSEVAMGKGSNVYIRCMEYN